MPAVLDLRIWNRRYSTLVSVPFILTYVPPLLSTSSFNIGFLIQSKQLLHLPSTDILSHFSNKSGDGPLIWP